MCSIITLSHVFSCSWAAHSIPHAFPVQLLKDQKPYHVTSDIVDVAYTHVCTQANYVHLKVEQFIQAVIATGRIVKFLPQPL